VYEKSTHIFLGIICFTSISIGCIKENQTVGTTEGRSENEIREIAYKSLSDFDKNTVINWKNAMVEGYNATTNHSIGSVNGLINIKDKAVYKVTFRTNNEGLLGPITLYLDKNTYVMVGEDLRD
jgi:hypothetical protein